MRTFPRPGVHPPEQKLSAARSVEEPPLPATLVLPLGQHIGAPAKAIVKAKAVVKRGELLAEAAGFVSVGLHSPVSGTVKKVGDYPHPSGGQQPAIEITVDPEADDQWAELPAPLAVDLAAGGFEPELRKEVIERVRWAGIVGLGGAAFPAHVKLSPPPNVTIDTLILNGAECEPYLTADHRVMLERPGDVVKGLQILLGLFPKSRGIIGVEANKPDAIAALRTAAAGDARISVEGLKTKYPQGGEKQLIWALTGRQVPSGKLPMAVGCVVQNVGTAVAIAEAVLQGLPLTQRVVTVTGSVVAEPKNLLVRLGTSYQHLIDACGGLKEAPGKVVNGGPMMGRAQPSLDLPVLKGSSGLLLLSEAEAVGRPETACIRCGACLTACPVVLQPTLLSDLVSYERWDALEGQGIMDCIECGSCSFACPAARRLAHRIRLGKLQLRRQKEKAKAKAAAAS